MDVPFGKSSLAVSGHGAMDLGHPLNNLFPKRFIRSSGAGKSRKTRLMCPMEGKSQFIPYISWTSLTMVNRYLSYQVIDIGKNSIFIEM
jgi:hypothetical protein